MVLIKAILVALVVLIIKCSAVMVFLFTTPFHIIWSWSYSLSQITMPKWIEKTYWEGFE